MTQMLLHVTCYARRVLEHLYTFRFRYLILLSRKKMKSIFLLLYRNERKKKPKMKYDESYIKYLIVSKTENIMVHDWHLNLYFKFVHLRKLEP